MQFLESLIQETSANYAALGKRSGEIVDSFALKSSRLPLSDYTVVKLRSELTIVS